jgi:hypothetical protein
MVVGVAAVEAHHIAELVGQLETQRVAIKCLLRQAIGAFEHDVVQTDGFDVPVAVRVSDRIDPGDELHRVPLGIAKPHARGDAGFEFGSGWGDDGQSERP